MLAGLVTFFDLLLAALLTGAMFGVFLVFNPKGLDGPLYVRLQQQAVRTLNTAMPVLGAATIAVTIAAAILARNDGVRFKLLVAGALGFVAAGLITRFLNQPINAVMMTWSAAAPPADWTELRDAWWRWHIARLLCGVGALSALILASLTAENI